MSDLTQSTVLVLIIAYHQDFEFNYGGEIGAYQFFGAQNYLGFIHLICCPQKRLSTIMNE